MEREEFKRSLKKIYDSVWDLKSSSARLRSGTNNDVDVELHKFEDKLHESLTFVANVGKLLGE